MSFQPKHGYFACRGCGNPLYSCKSKFDTNCGWPSFDKCYKNSIITQIDNSFGMNRIEIMCRKCSSHLGHVFIDEGYDKKGISRSNQRHCVNSISVQYIDSEPPQHCTESHLSIS